MINNVAIFGGTHGNELTGVYLVKKFQKFPHLIERPSLKTTAFLANLKAISLGRRYYETDLNRCFTPDDLSNPNLTQYEQILAKEIAHNIHHYQINFLIDLHSTTANMGLTIILSNNDHPLVLKLAAYLSNINPLVKILRYPITQNNSFLRGLCELGITIEVGAVAQGVLDGKLFQQTEQLIQTMLDYLEEYNQGKRSALPNTLTVYQVLEMIDYPRDNQGEIQGMIHPNLQFKDYQPLLPGDPLFLGLDGETITYQGESVVYPVFINEAAYYEKGIAMSLTEKQEIALD